jgi:hypothetical protein
MIEVINFTTSIYPKEGKDPPNYSGKMFLCPEVVYYFSPFSSPASWLLPTNPTSFSS